MKRSLMVAAFMLFAGLFNAYSQVSNFFNYQGIAIGTNDRPIRGRDIDVRFRIFEFSDETSPVFQERHSVTTNNAGQFSAQIGRGEERIGDLFSVNWNNIPVYLEVSFDINNDGNYETTILNEFPSVPYAFISGHADSDSTNEFQDLALTADSILITDGRGIPIPVDVSDFDSDSTNEFQDLALTADSILISNGEGIPIPFDVSDFDRDSTNEFQGLALTADSILISNGEGIPIPVDVSDFDRDSTNEFQNLALTADSILISNGEGIPIPVDVSDFDRDSTNEFQDLALTADSILISNGEGIPIPVDVSDFDRDSTNEFQDLALTLDSILITRGEGIPIPVDVNDFDRDSTNEFQGLVLTADSILITSGEGIPIPVDVSDFDRDSTNEFQDLALTADSILISNGEGIPIPVDVNDFDRDSTNEFQDLALTPDSILITNGKGIAIPSIASSSNMDFGTVQITPSRINQEFIISHDLGYVPSLIEVFWSSHDPRPAEPIANLGEGLFDGQKYATKFTYWISTNYNGYSMSGIRNQEIIYSRNEYQFYWSATVSNMSQESFTLKIKSLEKSIILNLLWKAYK